MKLLTEDNRPDLVELLTILQEEAAEVSQAASKLIRFGLNAKNPASPETNLEELTKELRDIVTVISIITQFGNMGITQAEILDRPKMLAKLEKISKHSTYWQFPDDSVIDVS